MRVGRLLPALFVLLGLLPLDALASSNPIPGVGIVVKHCSGGGTTLQHHCKSATRVIAPGGFFAPGSAPFDGVVPIQGRCGEACNGCDTECVGNEANPDGRIDYASETSAGPFDVIMPSTLFYSIDPIQVAVDGVDTFFDVFVTVRGIGLGVDDPIHGVLTLPPGGTLEVGTSSLVENSTLDLHSTMTFANTATGEAAGSAIEQDLHLDLHDSAGLALTRIADGTAGGRIVLGLDGSTFEIFTYTSANDELTLRMRSLHPDGAVPAQAPSWGALKTLYR